MTPHTTPSTREQITVTGGQLLEHAQRLLHEGNIRRIVLSHEGQTIAEFPLTFASSHGGTAAGPGGPEGEGVEPEPPEDIQRARHA